MKKSDSHLVSAKLLLKNDRLEESVSLTYCSMYYMLLSLFFRVGIKCENHSAAIILLKELFNIDNSLISYAKKERIDKQYYVDFKIMKKEVEELIEAAEIFNSKILDFIEKFRPRLKAIVTKTEGIGWGYHDTLDEIYYGELGEED